jgi:NAD+ kinase
VGTGTAVEADREYTIGLVVHPENPVRESVRLIESVASRHGIAVVAREADAARVGPDVTTVRADDFVDRVDGVVSLGGDGTMLGAMRLVVGRPTPVLGVNHGNLGFLVEVEPAALEPALDRLVRGDYSLEPHSCLLVDTDGGEHGVAFNDVVVTAAEPLTPVVVDLVINESAHHGYYRCDAVVACTPTGSTAYNFAAGGPIISPSNPCIALTPVAPMSGISRSIVLGDDVVGLRNPSPAAAAQIAVDGAPSGRVEPHATLTLRLCPDRVNVVRLDPGFHAQRSYIKLSLLDLPLRPDQLLDLFPPRLREKVQKLRKGAPSIGG